MNNLKKIISNFKVEDKEIYLLYFMPISLLAGSLIININIFMLVVAFFLKVKMFQLKKVLFSKLIIFLLIFNIYLIFNSIFISENLDSIIRAVGFVRFILLIIAISFFINFKNSKYFNKIIFFWTIVVFIACLDIVFEKIFGFNTFGFSSDYYGRIASFTGDELNIGGFLLGFTSFFLIYLFNNKKFSLFGILFFFTIAFITGERSNLFKIGLILFFCFLFILELDYKKKIFVILLSILSLVFVLSLDNSYKNRYINQIFLKIDTNNLNFTIKNNKHLLHYSTAYLIFKQNKLFGIGVKNFRNKSGEKKYQIFEDKNGHSIHPHQIHFEFLSELGLVGYLSMMSLLIYSVFLGLRSYSKNQKNYVPEFITSLFVLITILPILPSGSFFTTFTATLFWINFSFLMRRQFSFFS